MYKVIFISFIFCLWHECLLHFNWWIKLKLRVTFSKCGKYLSYIDMHKNKKYVCRYESYFAKCALAGVLAGWKESEWIHVFLSGFFSQSECWGLSFQEIIFNSLHNLKVQITVHLPEFRGFICKNPSSSSHSSFTSFNPICIPWIFLTFLSIVMFSDILWEDCLSLCCWWF